VQCRKEYTNKLVIQTYLHTKSKAAGTPETNKITLRSTATSDFDFKNDCLICGGLANIAEETKKPVNRRR
jgi:hypothetical protein